MSTEGLAGALREAQRILMEADRSAPQRGVLAPVLQALSRAASQLGRIDATSPPLVPASEDRIRELEQRVRAHDEFLSTLGHELRNPLSPIFMQAQYLLDAARQVEGGTISSRWLIPRLQTLCQRLSKFLGMLNRIMDLSRLSAGRMHLELEEVDLSELVQDVCSSLEREFELARSELRMDIEAHVVGRWDRLRLEQICSNLLSNALRYGAGKPIHVSVSADPEHARFAVRDRGTGIAEADRERIFQRFERAVEARHSGGFGIGLWIVRESCLAMGGDVTVQSRLGSGSTFTVTLPRCLRRVNDDP